MSEPEVPSIKSWFAGKQVASTVHIRFKPGSDLNKEYEDAIATKTGSEEWEVAAGEVVETFPSDDHPESIHDLFLEDGREGFWAALNQSDLAAALGTIWFQVYKNAFSG